MAETFDLGNALMRGAQMGSQIANARGQNNALAAGMMPTSDAAFVQPVNVPISIGGQTVNQPMSPMNALKFQQGQEDRAYDVGQRPLERGQMEAEIGLTEAQIETERERVGLVMAQAAEATAKAAATASETEIEEARFEAAQLYNAARQAWSDGPEAWDRFEAVLGDDLAQSGFDPVQVGYEDGLMIIGRLGGAVKGLSPEYLDRAMAALREGRVAPSDNQDMPADVQSLTFRAEQAGLEPGTPEYQQFMLTGGDVETGPSWRAATPKEAQARGAQAGQINSETGEFKAINPPSGMSITMGPDGTMRFTQGPGEQDPLDRSNPSSPVAMIESIDGILSDPAFENATGILSFMQNVPGTQARGFGARMRQLEGQAFLQAFESLKGAGQITEIEGLKATQAMGRLDSAQRPADLRDALSELKGILELAASRPEGWAAQQGGQGANSAPQADVAGNTGNSYVGISREQFNQIDISTLTPEQVDQLYEAMQQ